MKTDNAIYNSAGRPRKRSCGMTLIEVLVAASISTIILSVVVSFLIAGRQMSETGQAFTVSHGNARLAADWITRDVRAATQIMDNHDGFTTETDCLILEVPSIDAAGDVIFATDDEGEPIFDEFESYDYIIYRQSDADSSILERIVDIDAGSSRAAFFTNDSFTPIESIDSLEFSSGGAELSDVADVTSLDNVDISISTGQTLISGRRTVENNMSTNVKLRNQ
ncbi:type II secretion system protein J [Candidatus Omnitrophota bacterium]